MKITTRKVLGVLSCLLFLVGLTHAAERAESSVGTAISTVSSDNARGPIHEPGDGEPRLY